MGLESGVSRELGDAEDIIVSSRGDRVGESGETADC